MIKWSILAHLLECSEIAQKGLFLLIGSYLFDEFKPCKKCHRNHFFTHYIVEIFLHYIISPSKYNFLKVFTFQRVKSMKETVISSMPLKFT